MTNNRSSGILLHPTSLPGPFGIGDFGPAAYGFADFLQSAGQKFWQMLPLTPTGQGNSPYSSDSAFAGNILLVSPELLIDEGFLEKHEPEPASFAANEVDYATVRTFKEKILRRAYDRFAHSSRSSLRTDFEDFCARHNFWLEDYVLFRALKKKCADKPWKEWDEKSVHRDANALAEKKHELQKQIEAEKFFQFLFFRQWLALKSHCNSHGIRLIGDLPIFVAHDSVDVWSAPELFRLDATGEPLVVAGVPPDYFSKTGQLWGNPLYNWQQMRAQNFDWWVRRMRLLLEMFDVVRIDHFRGFVACWEIAAGERTAEHGKWAPVPGRELFARLREKFRDLPVIAEDLGYITADVDQLRTELGFPGMRVLQFAFDRNEDNVHLPSNYVKNTVAYTATHDSDTTVGWFQKANAGERERCLRYLGASGEQINLDFINAVSGSIADTVIVPLQDVLGLGSEARMNVPSVAEGNWKWRVAADALTPDVAAALKNICERNFR